MIRRSWESSTQFANHHSNDWNMQDTIGTIGPCGDGKTYEVNQPLQWINAGWTIDKMFRVGKDILDTTAASFPNQPIKLPIGGLADALVLPFLGPDNGYGSFGEDDRGLCGNDVVREQVLSPA